MDNEIYDDSDSPEVESHTHAVPLNTLLTNKQYDFLKWLAQIVLPALGALYFGLAQVWGFPNGEEVVGTITVLDVFLGVLLGFSSRSYTTATEGPHVGFVDVTKTETGKRFELNFPGDPLDIDQHDKVTFKVRRH